MGLKCTDIVATSLGDTNALYIYINEMSFNKTGKCVISVLYKKEQGGGIVIVLPPLSNRFDFQLDGVEMSDWITKQEAYTKIKASLIEAGKTIVDVI